VKAQSDLSASATAASQQITALISADQQVCTIHTFFAAPASSEHRCFHSQQFSKSINDRLAAITKAVEPAIPAVAGPGKNHISHKLTTTSFWLD
jgi:hypothetical protein